jgi:TonB family protein
VVSAPVARWPDDLRARGVGGDVELVLEVDVAGRVRGVRVLRSPHRRLSIEAVRAARGMRFESTGTASTVWRVLRFAEDEDESVMVVLARAPWREGRTAARTAAHPPGSYVIERTDLQDQPGAGGDVARAVATLPAVSSTSLRNPSLAIRGGAPEETLWVVDDMALPSRRSAGGMLARVNPALVERVTVHAGTQPATVGESAAGVVRVELLDPDDTEVDGQLEVSPLLGQAWVSTPLGRPGAGNAVLFAARRSLIEPWVAALRWVDKRPDLDVVVGDVALRARFEPAAGHEVRVTASHGEERLTTQGLDGSTYDRSGTDLVQLRHAWSVSPRTLVQTDLALIHEVQDVWRDEQDRRTDRRFRPSGRVDVRFAPFAGHELHAGGEVSRSQLYGEGVVLDPRTRPVFDRAPWRDLDPPQVRLDVQARWTEVATWLQWHMTPAAGIPVHADVGVRTTWMGPWDTVVTSPRVSVAWELPIGTVLRGWGAGTHQLPRDPVHLDVALGPSPITPARAMQVGFGVEQPLAQVVGLRLDAWRRVQRGIVVWSDDVSVLRSGARSATTGVGTAQGMELSLAARGGPVQGVLSYAGVMSERTNPLATLGPSTAEPWWVVPHTLRLTADAQLGRRGEYKLGTHVQVRSGARQATVSVSGDVDDFLVSVEPNGGQRLPTSVRWSVRVQRRIVLRRLQLTVYADLMQLVGGSTPIGVAVRPVQGALPELVNTKDLPFLPWLGARAEF